MTTSESQAINNNLELSQFTNRMKKLALVLFSAFGAWSISQVIGILPGILMLVCYGGITIDLLKRSKTVATSCFILITILIFGTTAFLCCVRQGQLIYVNGAYELVTETKFFVNPFAFERPTEAAPQSSGRIKIKNEPMEWIVSANYKLEPETRLMVEDLASMRLLLKEGFEIPRSLYSVEHNPKIAVEDYLIEKYPFLRFEVVVRKFTTQVWK